MNENGREGTNEGRRRRSRKRRGNRQNDESERAESTSSTRSTTRKRRSGRNSHGKEAKEERRRGVPGRPRLKWTPPVLPAEPIPTLVCPLCGKVITDLPSALTDRVSGEAAHFDCVRNEVVAAETLCGDEIVSYIGAGRFGVIEYKDKNKRLFTIKKIIEYEDSGVEKRADWRNNIADHFSMT